MMEDKKVYVSTYFRIEMGYRWGGDNPGIEEEKSEAFYKEIVTLLESIGFETYDRFKFSKGGCPTLKRGAENVYCHPMHISGYIVKEEVEKIENLLKTATTFTFRTTDTFKEKTNYTTEEFLEELAKTKDIVEEKLLEKFTTKRKNLYKYEGSTAWDLKTGVNYLPKVSNIKYTQYESEKLYGFAELERQFVSDTFEGLQEKGLIVSAELKSGKGYRKLNKEEMKAWMKNNK